MGEKGTMGRSRRLERATLPIVEKPYARPLRTGLQLYLEELSRQGILNLNGLLTANYFRQTPQTKSQQGDQDH